MSAVLKMGPATKTHTASGLLSGRRWHSQSMRKLTAWQQALVPMTPATKLMQLRVWKPANRGMGKAHARKPGQNKMPCMRHAAHLCFANCWNLKIDSLT